MQHNRALQMKAAQLLYLDKWYKNSPIRLLLESYVLSLIDELSTRRDEQMRELELSELFEMPGADWKQVVRDVLHLGEPAEVCVRDGWYRLLEAHPEEPLARDAVAYARDFVSGYLARDFDLDDWASIAYKQARQRVNRIRAREE